MDLVKATLLAYSWPVRLVWMGLRGSRKFWTMMVRLERVGGFLGLSFSGSLQGSSTAGGLLDGLSPFIPLLSESEERMVMREDLAESSSRLGRVCFRGQDFVLRS